MKALAAAEVTFIALRAVKISKGIEDDVPSQKIGKQDTNTCVSNKGILTGTNNATRNTQESKGKNIVEALNLQSILISLLMNKPDGMTLKALEKAVKGVVPYLKKKINPIVRKIASYKYPGRYILLPGVDSESFKNPLTESESSPDDNHPQLSAHQEFRDETPAPKGVIKENVTEDGLEELVQLNSKIEQLSTTLENINGQHFSPDIFEGKKGPDLSEGQEDNSSDRGSESGGRSHSESRSRSTVERGCRSGSDSEDGASSNSEEALYEGVDIVTSYDERESMNKTKVSAKRVFSLIPVNLPMEDLCSMRLMGTSIIMNLMHLRLEKNLMKGYLINMREILVRTFVREWNL